MNMLLVNLKFILVTLLLSHNAPALFFFFNDTATTEIYTLSLHDALPILIEQTSKPLPIPSSNLELTGITTIFGKKQVVLNGKQVKSTLICKTHTVFRLNDGIEVLDINESEGEVRVRNHGIETLLTFTKNA